MAGFDNFGYGSSSTLSPLAPPFTVYQMKSNSSSQAAGSSKDFGLYSNCSGFDHRSDTYPVSVENSYASSSYDPNFLSLGLNTALPYAQESVCVSSIPVAEAEPFYPKYPLPLNKYFEASVPSSLCGFSYSSPQTDPWNEVKVEPDCSSASSWKEFKGKVLNYKSPMAQGLNFSKGNPDISQGHYAESLAKRNNMEPNVFSTNHIDESSRHSAKEHDGFFPYSSGSNDLQASFLPPESSFSNLSGPSLPVTEWFPIKPITPSWLSVSPLSDGVKVESTIPKSDTFLSQHLMQPACYYGTNIAFESGASPYSWNISNNVAFHSSKQSTDAEQTISGQIGNNETRILAEGNFGSKDLSSSSSNHATHKISPSQNGNLNQKSIFCFSSGSGSLLPSSSDITDQLNHAVDSPCWKGDTLSSSLFAAAIQASKHSTAGLEASGSPELCRRMSKKDDSDLEVICSPPSKNLFSVWVTSQVKSGDDGQAEAIGSDNAGCGSVEAGSHPVKINSCTLFSSEIQDSVACHVISESAKSDFQREATCPISNVENNVNDVGVPCSQISERKQFSESKQVSSPKLRAENIVETICNLCSLLLSSQCCDLSTLQDEDYKNFQSTMNSVNIHLAKRKKDDELGCNDGLNKIVDSSPQIGMGSKSESLLANLKNIKQDSPIQLQDNCSFISNISKADGFSIDETDCRSAGTTQVLEKHLRENVFCSEEVHPQTMVYKDLWIEAEAALCTMKYKFQCAQMQIKNDKVKDLPVKDGEKSARMLRSPVVENMPYMFGHLDTRCLPNLDERQTRTKDIALDDRLSKNMCSVDQKNPTDISSDEMSVMGRFKILKNRIDGPNITHAQSHVSDDILSMKSGLRTGREKMDIANRETPVMMAIPDLSEVGAFLEHVPPNACMSESLKNLILGVEGVGHRTSSAALRFNKP